MASIFNKSQIHISSCILEASQILLWYSDLLQIENYVGKEGNPLCFLLYVKYSHK